MVNIDEVPDEEEDEEPRAAGAAAKDGEASDGEAGGLEADGSAEPAEGGADKYGLDQGKEQYQKGNYEEAVKSWTRSLQSVKYILDKGLYKDKPEQLKEVHDMEVKICVNMAMGCIKTGDYNKAVEHADKALAREGTNAKALYRKATALKSLLSFTEAAAVLERLLQVEPENAAAKALLQEVRRDAQRSLRNEKKMSQKIFASPGPRDPRVPPTAREALLEALWAAPGEARAFVSECMEWCRELPGRLMNAVRSLLETIRQQLPFGPAPAAAAAAGGGQESKKQD